MVASSWSPKTLYRRKNPLVITGGFKNSAGKVLPRQFYRRIFPPNTENSQNQGKFRRWKEDKPIEDADFIHVPIWLQFWNLPEHYKTKELGRKLGSSFGDIIKTDLFQVTGLERCIVKAKVWLDLTKPLRRSLKVSGPNKIILNIDLKEVEVLNMKENVDPYAYHDKDTNHSKPSKLVPVNLIKSLASLSMNSPIPEATPMHTRPIDQNPNSHQEFIFATSKDKPQSLPPNMTMKQKARHKFKPVAGIKRS
ncbi:hypothetical protein PIB30_044585 [Stylosanthes scabra]|uniref:DUF4283 domain-containing protein n=1 Tax=Stylosanthes scabra TaxID=79078 RepID=A0ABU6YET9_9FABA|nr:hypothetical protein [Stylosanthes scabra]